MLNSIKNPLSNLQIIFSMSIIILAVILISGCETPPRARPASEYLYTTDKPTTRLLNEIQAKLEENKYKIKKNDPNSGILVAEPRSFSFDSGGRPVKGVQKVNIRQEGGSLKVRITYTCDYNNPDMDGRCNSKDMATQDKINKIEKILMKELSPLFEKHADEDEW